jgi:endogenous inhibitor of DNA gyrase (YacG/DUF329 family)
METDIIAKAKCPYCGKEIVVPNSRKIISIGRDRVTGKKKVIETEMVFCSKVCGGNYQMGCEG